MIETIRVDGEKRCGIIVYALSTCVWCKMAKNLLNNMGAAYEYIDVDLLSEDDKDEVMKEVRRWNPKGSFPTLVFDGERVVLGYDEKKIREAIGS